VTVVSKLPSDFTDLISSKVILALPMVELNDGSEVLSSLRCAFDRSLMYLGRGVLGKRETNSRRRIFEQRWPSSFCIRV
jgi:hypothetical protein